MRTQSLLPKWAFEAGLLLEILASMQVLPPCACIGRKSAANKGIYFLSFGFSFLDIGIASRRVVFGRP
jgi:hypothetical protein